MISDGTAAVLFAGIFFIAGVLLFYTSAWDKILEARMYLGMETFDPATGGDDEGLLAARGSVTASDGSVSGPLTGEDCVAFVREDHVLERKVTNDPGTVDSSPTDSDDDTTVVYSWELRDATQEYVPFEIETDHGSIAVSPGYADLDLPVQDSDVTSLAGRILYRIPLAGQLVDRPTKTVEKHLPPGETVTVVGDIQAVEDSNDLVGAVEGAGDRGAFTVTSKSGKGLTVRSLFGAVLSSFPALLCFIITVGAIIIGVETGALP